MNDFTAQRSARIRLLAATLISALLIAATQPALAQRGRQLADVTEMMEALQIRDDQEEAFRSAMEEIRNDEQGQHRQARGQGREQRSERSEERGNGARGEAMRQQGQRRENGNYSGEMNREQMQERQQRAEEILSDVLTEEQMARFRDYRRERRREMMQQRRQRNSG